MDTAIIVAVIAAISSSGVSSLIIYLLQRRDKLSEKTSETEKLKTQMLLGLAHECILRRAETYIDRGSVTTDEYNELKKYLYTPYKALGGNGTAERVMRDVEELEIMTRERTRKEASPV